MFWDFTESPSLTLQDLHGDLSPPTEPWVFRVVLHVVAGDLLKSCACKHCLTSNKCTMGWFSHGHQRKLSQSLLMPCSRQNISISLKQISLIRTWVVRPAIFIRLYTGFRGHYKVTPGDRLSKAVTLGGSCCTLLWRYGRSKADVERSNNLTLLWASILMF